MDLLGRSKGVHGGVMREGEAGVEEVTQREGVVEVIETSSLALLGSLIAFTAYCLGFCSEISSVMVRESHICR